MRKILLGGAVAASALLGPAGPASAGCYGTANLAVLCATVSPLGGTYYEDCVYTGSGTCTPVSVPGPSVTQCGGSVLGEPIRIRCQIP